jgi:hypothetical protein
LFLKNLNPLRRVREFLAELKQVRQECNPAQREVQQLEKGKQRLRDRLDRLQQENERLQPENERLRSDRKAALRAGQLQAAPFSCGKPKKDPKSPGRKSGKDHGPHHRRPIPDQVDEVIKVAAPEQRPHCGGGGMFARKPRLRGKSRRP